MESRDKCEQIIRWGDDFDDYDNHHDDGDDNLGDHNLAISMVHDGYDQWLSIIIMTRKDNFDNFQHLQCSGTAGIQPAARRQVCRRWKQQVVEFSDCWRILRLSKNCEIVSIIGMIIMLMTMMTQEKDSSVEPRSDVEWTRKHRWQCEWQCYHYQWHTPATPSTQIPTPPYSW